MTLSTEGTKNFKQYKFMTTRKSWILVHKKELFCAHVSPQNVHSFVYALKSKIAVNFFSHIRNSLFGRKHFIKSYTKTPSAQSVKKKILKRCRKLQALYLWNLESGRRKSPEEPYGAEGLLCVDTPQHRIYYDRDCHLCMLIMFKLYINIGSHHINAWTVKMAS